jgi:hypothetical protein
MAVRWSFAESHLAVDDKGGGGWIPSDAVAVLHSLALRLSIKLDKPGVIRHSGVHVLETIQIHFRAVFAAEKHQGKSSWTFSIESG